MYGNEKYIDEMNSLTDRFCYYRQVVSNSSQYRPDNYTAMEDALVSSKTGGVYSGFLSYWRDQPHAEIMYPIEDTSCGTCTSVPDGAEA